MHVFLEQGETTNETLIIYQIQYKRFSDIFKLTITLNPYRIIKSCRIYVRTNRGFGTARQRHGVPFAFSLGSSRSHHLGNTFSLASQHVRKKNDMPRGLSHFSLILLGDCMLGRLVDESLAITGSRVWGDTIDILHGRHRSWPCIVAGNLETTGAFLKCGAFCLFFQLCSILEH